MTIVPRTKVYADTNPGQMYMDALLDLVQFGSPLAPRGKRIQELRPVVMEFHNPLKQVTFLKGRVINPFFQRAEALWIMAGRSDVKWLEEYNSAIASFSDDGMFFNAPYGERLRFWGKNDASGFVFNPLDQLLDTYKKLLADPDSRQAVAFIGDPRFDNHEYTSSGGKDIACNINIKFKIRDGALDITVDNRSNDLHWGTFGANLAQFSTIQQLMASWLGIPVGVYSQVTDSLHIYLDEYGAKETQKIADAYGYDTGLTHWYKVPTPVPSVLDYEEDAARITVGFEDTERILRHYFLTLDPIVRSDETYTAEGEGPLLNALIEEFLKLSDPYFRDTFLIMLAYQAHKRGNTRALSYVLSHVSEGSWKVSCLRFLSKRYLQSDTYKDFAEEFRSHYAHLSPDIIEYIERKGE